MTRFLLLLTLVLSVSSCGSVDVTRYADQQPALNLERFFSQPVKAWGMFQKRSGEVAKRFEVNIASRREGNNLILEQVDRDAGAASSLMVFLYFMIGGDDMRPKRYPYTKPQWEIEYANVYWDSSNEPLATFVTYVNRITGEVK